MKKPTALLVSTLALATSLHAAISVPTTGVYDSTSNANVVDAVAGVGVVSGGSAAETALNNYKSVFATAFANGRGGVIQFDGWVPEAGDTTPTINNAMTTTFGSGVLNISRIGGTGNFQFDSSPTTLGTAISGTMYLRSETENFHTLSFSQGLSALGFTVLSRNNSRTIQATVTYFEGGTDVISGEYVGVDGSPTANADKLDDTFFGFTAPTGKTIQSVKIEATDAGNSDTPKNFFFAIDDFGYVVAVPEPSAAGLALLSAVGLLARRRRA